MGRGLQLTFVLIAAVLIAAVVSHTAAAWLRINTHASEVLTFGKANGNPPAFMAGSSLAAYAINWEQIANDYNEAVKHAVALKLGIVEADVMVKRFSNDNYEHPVYKVFTEVGKAKKTIFLCNYIQSEELRIEIHEALNIVERVNSIMSFICYGKLGEISTNFRIDQELAIACLHLLQVAMGYINTILHQDILSTPEWEGVLTKEDHRALNILFHGNINPYGLFPLNLDTRLGVPVFNNENEDTSESEFMLEEID